MKKRTHTISPNVAACIKGIRLLGAGKVKLARELMGKCAVRDLEDAASILEEQALWASKISEIADRHQARTGTVGSILKRASAAGDKEAKALIGSGILDYPVYR